MRRLNFILNFCLLMFENYYCFNQSFGVGGMMMGFCETKRATTTEKPKLFSKFSNKDRRTERQTA